MSDRGEWLPPVAPGPPPPSQPEVPEAPLRPQPRSAAGTWQGLELSGWWPRVGATVIDTLVVLVLGFTLAVVGALASGGAEEAAAIAFVLGVVLAGVLYAPLLMRRPGDRNGQTWGKQVCRIRVVRVDRAPISFGQAFLREFVIKAVLFNWIGGTLVIGWLLDVLWPLWDDQNRALHDLMVETRVVRT